MPIQLPLPRRKYAAAVLAAVLLMLGGLVALLTPAAHADQNTGVKVTFEPLVLADKDGQEFPGKPAHQEDPVRMRFAWDASAANPQPGESFSITLPAEYRYREIGRKDDLILGNGTKVGDCVTTSDTLTCTFNTAISAATELKGSGNQMIVAQKVTQTNKTTFDANGTQTEIFHPNNEPILAQKVTQTNKTTFDANGTQTEIFHPNNEPILPIAWVEKDLGKYANSLKRESTALTWHIQFSGTTIANHLKAADGTVSTVTFTDVAGGGQVLNDDKGTWYVRVNPKQYGGGADAYFDVARADGTVMSAEHGTFTLTPTIGEDGMTASVTLTRTDGAFDSDTNYEIVYQSLAEGGRIVPGKVYTNSATLKGGAGTTVNAQMSYKDPISYDVQLTQGFGSFGVKKYITGAHQDRVTADTKVTATVAYELPKGTTKKLTEQTDPKALPESLAWGSKIFSIDGTETPDTTTFTVGESVTAVGLPPWACTTRSSRSRRWCPAPSPSPRSRLSPSPPRSPAPRSRPSPARSPAPRSCPSPARSPAPRAMSCRSCPRRATRRRRLPRRAPAPWPAPAPTSWWPCWSAAVSWSREPSRWRHAVARSEALSEP